jgi:glycosyltransferase involved in cell wall biosynthesis
MIDVTVIIPVYNRAKKVKRAVQSVLEQTLPPAEVIVVDDGSEDDPASGLNKIFGSRLKIGRQTHQGVAAARNLGIRESKTEWLAFLDSDDLWMPSKLEKQVRFHEKNPECLISQTDELWMRNGKRVNPKRYHLKPEGDVFELSLSRCLISPSAVLIHRRIFEEIGLFDPDLPACEDYDLWLRASSKYKVGLIPDKLVVKTGGHPDQLSQKYWGMDRFRVKALEKLINGFQLNAGQRMAAVEKLIEKLIILKIGAKKRGEFEQVKSYNNLIYKYTDLRHGLKPEFQKHADEI